jgi:hypothetical protein
MRNARKTAAAVSLGAALFLAQMAGPAPAGSQAFQCGARAMIVGHLADTYQEAPVAIGVSARGQLLEIFASPDGATWTILMTTADKISCAVAAGRDLQVIAAPPKGPRT